MATFKKLKEGFLEYKSVKVHVGVAVLQLIIALGLILPVVIIIDKYADFILYREAFIYIVFEIFRLWLVLDSIVQRNSITIYITGFLALIVLTSSIMTIYETTNETYSYYLDLLEEKQMFRNLLIGFSSSLIVLTIPALWAAYKMSRDFGWGVYKKIGARLDVQKRFRMVQCFSLVIKLDLFFEFAFFQLMVTTFVEWFSYTLYTLNYFIILLSIIISREAIARESYTLMILSLCMQIEFLAVLIYFIIENFEPKYLLPVFVTHVICSFACCLGTIILGAICMFNFNKGLKEHVQWSFFGIRSLPNSKYENNKPDTSEKLLSARIDMPIDED